MSLSSKTKAALAALLASTPACVWADPVSLMMVVGQFMVVKGVGLVVYAGYAMVAAGIIYGATSRRRDAKRSAMAARDAYNASLEDRGANIISGIPPWRIVYGRATVGASIHAMFTTDKATIVNGETITRKDALHYLVYVFTAHKCAQLHDVKIDGASVGPFDTEGYSLNSEYRQTESRWATGEVYLTPGQSHTSSKPFVSYYAEELNAYSDYAQGVYPPDLSADIGITNNGKTATNNHETKTLVFSYRFFRDAISSFRFLWHDGDDNQLVDPVLNALFPDKWTANHRLRGRAYAVVMVDIEDPKFQGGPPQITVDVTGRLVYDPRNATTTGSSNNALCIRDYLLSKWGANASAAEVEDTHATAAAFACDSLVDIKVPTFSDNIVSDFSATVDGWVGHLTTVARIAGSPSYINAQTTAPGGFVTKDGMSFSGAANRYVRFRIQRTAGEGWTGKLYYKTAGHGYSEEYRKDLSTGLSVLAPLAEIVFDMHSLTAGQGDWKSSTITGLRFAFGAEVNDGFDIYWVRVSAFAETTEEQPKYTLNGTFTTDDNREAVLENMAASMNGFVTNSGSWLIVAGSWAAPVRDFGDDDLDGQISVSQADTSIDELSNSAKGTYYPVGASSPMEFDAYQNGVLVAADGEELWDDFALPFTSDASRARNLARNRVERTRSGQILSVPLKLHAWNLQVGDRIRLTSTEYGLSLKPFRVTDWGFSLTGAVLVTAQEDAEEIYDEADTALSDPTPNTNLKNPNVVQDVVGLSAASGTEHLTLRTDGTVHARLRLSWTAALDPYLVAGSAYLEIAWRRVGKDPSTMTRVQKVSATDTSAYLEDVSEFDTLTIGARYVNSLGRTGASTHIWHTVIGKSAPPTTVTGLTGTVSRGLGVLVWDTPPDLDYDVTELRLDGTSWEDALSFFKGKANTYSHSVLAAGSYVIRAKHIDTSGNYSADEASFVLVVAEEDLGGGQYTDYIFGRFASPPLAPTGDDPTEDVSPVWFDAPPVAEGNPLWVTTADKTSAGVLMTAWTTPVQLEASALLAEYSVDGSTSWHSTFTAGDLYGRYSTDGGATWTDAIKIVGEDGTSVVIKGSVANIVDLPASGNTAGDLYVVLASGDGYVWNGASWDNVGPIRGPAGNTGNYIAYVFRRSASQPSTPTGDTPAGWADAPPAATGNPLWASTGEKTYAGALVGSWTTPVQIEGAGVTVEYSINGSTLWHSTYVSADIYARYSTDGGATWSAAVRIVGEDGVSAVMSNGAHVLPASTAGVVSSYVGSGTEIRVYEGGAALTFVTGTPTNGQWRIASKAGTNISPGATMSSGTYATIGVHSGVASGTDTAKVLYSIDGKTNRGASFAITQEQTFSKSKTGSTGDTGSPGLPGGYTDYVFRRAATLPATPTTATPSGWFDAPPAADGNPLWVSTADKTGAGVLVGVWTTPVQLEGAEVQAEYSANGSTLWHSTFTSGDLYGRYSTDGGATWTDAIKIVGEDALTLALTATGLAFTGADSTATTVTGPTISFTANLQNVSGTATFVATRYNAAGTSLGTFTMGGSGNTRTVTAAQFTDSGTAATVQVTVVATLGALSDTVTVYRTNNGDPGHDAPLLYLTANGIGFVGADAAATTVSGSDISFTASLTNLSGTAAFVATAYSAAGTSLGTFTMGGSGNTRTVTAAQFTNSGTWATRRVVVTATLGAVNDLYTVYRADNGSSVVQGSVINSAHTLPAAADGTVSSYVGSGSVIRVVEGVTELQFTTGTPAAGQWAATRATISGTITPGAISVSGLTGVMAAHSGMTTDTAQVRVTITGKTLTGASFPTITLDQTLTKSKAGDTGGTGLTGNTGQSNHRAYKAVTIGAPPATPGTTTSGATPATWSATPLTLTTGQEQYQSDGTTPAGSTTTTWATPYPSYLKVATLEAITANMGTLTAGSVNTSGYIKAEGFTGTTVQLAGSSLTVNFSGVYNSSLTQESGVAGLSSTDFRPGVYGYNSNASSGMGVAGQGFSGVYGQANNATGARGGRFLGSSSSFATVGLEAESGNTNTGSVALKATANTLNQFAAILTSSAGTALSVVGKSTFSTEITSTASAGNALTVARPIVSTLPNGTAPFTVTSSTLVANLNASMVNGLNVAYSANWWEKLAVIAADGALEGMKYLDFRGATTETIATRDYSVRLEADNDGGTTTGTGLLRLAQKDNVSYNVLAGIAAAAGGSALTVINVPSGRGTTLKWLKCAVPTALDASGFVYIPYV